MSHPIHRHDAAIYLGRLPRTLAHAGWIVVETVVIPTALLLWLIDAHRPMTGLVMVALWRSGCIAARLLRRLRVPTTVWIAFGLFLARTVAGLSMASVNLYLWVPIVVSATFGLIFVATAFGPRPLILRCLGDFVTLTPAAMAHTGVRNLCAVLTGWWGAIHVACAGLGAWAMTLSTSGSVAVTGLLGLVSTVVAVGGCIVLGLAGSVHLGLRWRHGEPPATRAIVGVP